MEVRRAPGATDLHHDHHSAPCDREHDDRAVHHHNGAHDQHDGPHDEHDGAQHHGADGPARTPTAGGLMGWRPPNHPSEDPQDDVDPEVEEAERFRRWFLCPVVGCDTVEEYDARDKTAHYCPSDQHPSTRLRVYFNGRLLRA
jgi:hypothetical protein